MDFQKSEIIQAGINYILIQMENIKHIIDNHPKEDVEFIEMQERHLSMWQNQLDFALHWKNSILNKK